MLCPKKRKMLVIKVPAQQLWHEGLEEFIDIPETVLTLEHSLLSISKWESKWKKPFLDSKPKTKEEERDYIRCMTIGSPVNSLCYYGLTNKNISAISSYIADPMSATTVQDNSRNPAQKRHNKVITSEVIYSWMVAYQIPFECEKWHLNRLMMLIQVCAVNNSTDKMSKKDNAKQMAAINAARRAKMHTHG